MLSNIKLNRPIVIFDLETTGVSVTQDRIIELSATKFHPNGQKEKINHVMNPGIPIPPEASTVHGFTDKSVKDKPRFQEFASGLYDFFKDCDLAGFNIANFDVPLFAEEFSRTGLNPPFDESTKILDGLKVFHHFEKRDLTAAYKFYCGKSLENAHSADADVAATIEVINSQIKHYALPDSVSELAAITQDGERLDFAGKFARDNNGHIILTFGKHKGEKAVEASEYLDWMVRKGDFPAHTKLIAQKIRSGKLK